jgi:hypothetical protein
MDPVAVRRPAPRSLDDVRDPDGDDSYPVELLMPALTGLVLFAARWYGRQDAYWFARYSVQTTCVDLDGDRLDDMARVYPKGWEFQTADVFAFGADAVGRQTWDVVSLDPFTNDMDACASLIDLWAGLARRAVVIGATSETRIEPPHGWRVVSRDKRSDFDGGIYWVALTR